MEWALAIVGAGFLGVVLALVLQRGAVIVAGLVGGGWLGVEIWRLLATAPPGMPWLPAVVGAVLGALLAATLFDAVLVVLSSLVGAALLARLFGGRPATQGIVLLVLALLGTVLQTRARRHAT